MEDTRGIRRGVRRATWDKQVSGCEWVDYGPVHYNREEEGCGKNEFRCVHAVLPEEPSSWQLDTWQSLAQKEAEAGRVHLEATGALVGKAMRKIAQGSTK